MFKFNKEVSDSIYFKVHGAGELRISKSPNWETGNGYTKNGRVVGFSVGVSWGEDGYAGGVLSRDEARKLANHILKQLGEQ